MRVGDCFVALRASRDDSIWSAAQVYQATGAFIRGVR
jgi:hypothetical protein